MSFCDASQRTLYDLVDAVSAIVGQRGRFTLNPPLITLPPTRRRDPSPARADNAKERLKSATLPDADLDNQLPPPAQTVAVPAGEEHDVVPVKKSWDEYVRYNSVVFDFRGSSGVQGTECVRNSFP